MIIYVKLDSDWNSIRKHCINIVWKLNLGILHYLKIYFILAKKIKLYKGIQNLTILPC